MQNKKPETGTPIEWLKNAIYGMIIGVANIIPGVSGGTMAVILNIYDRLIFGISTFRKDWRKSIGFLIQIAVGAAVGILIFSHVIKLLLATYPMQLNWFFIGLIIGSIPLIFKKTRASKGQFIPKATAFVVTLALMIYFAMLNKDAASADIETVLTFSLAIRLFVNCIIAAAAMILPGVSGSLVLVILGSYFTVLTAIADMNIILLIPVALGCAIGIVGGSKAIAFAMHRWEGITFSGILGLVIGSIATVYVKAGFVFGWGGFAAILCMAVATVIAYWFGRHA